MVCTHSRNEKTKKCRSKKEHERLSRPKRTAKRSCTHSRNQKTRKCRSKREHEAALTRARRSFAKYKLGALAKHRASVRRQEKDIYGDDGYVPFAL